MIEAKCTRCHGTFVPAEITAEDLIHGVREDDEFTECGGIGIVQGRWILDDKAADRGWSLTKLVLAQEKHGKEYPHCDDPDCEFHHPELIEG